ncbi:MAG TPA: hypothetical protein VGH53_31210 [Streptosporangiaceae bacterium]
MPSRAPPSPGAEKQAAAKNQPLVIDNAGVVRANPSAVVLQAVPGPARSC